MDESTRELLSRAVDDDLSAMERRELEARLAAEPELRETLADLSDVRRSVRALADRMAPPEALDALVMPLRRDASPGGSSARSAIRWFATAAGLVLALSIGYRMGSRSAPGQSLGALNRVARTPGVEEFVPYQLRPLPTRSGAPSEELLGASERLLATTPRPPDPESGGALEVVGPSLTIDAAPRAEEPRLVLRVDGSAYLLPAPALAGCGGLGHWAAVVDVRGGQIVTVVMDEDEEEAARRSCGLRLVGLPAPGLQDGTYSGEVVTLSPG